MIGWDVCPRCHETVMPGRGMGNPRVHWGCATEAERRAEWGPTGADLGVSRRATRHRPAGRRPAVYEPEAYVKALLADIATGTGRGS